MVVCESGALQLAWGPVRVSVSVGGGSPARGGGGGGRGATQERGKHCVGEPGRGQGEGGGKLGNMEHPFPLHGCYHCPCARPCPFPPQHVRRRHYTPRNSLAARPSLGSAGTRSA